MKTKFPLAAAQAVADEITRALRPGCAEVVIAGSVRRLKPEVSDVEIVYVPRVETQPDPGDLFASRSANYAEEAIAALLKAGTLAKRKNVNGAETFGPRNKLLVHMRTGIPVDLFATAADCLANYLVCRTGPAELNQHIATLALKRGWRWNPYGPGFTALSGEASHPVTSEREVFDFVGLPYREPRERVAP
jgi:DNA polymerase/3'-5' exonuclease PolX